MPLLLNVPYAEKDEAKALGARWNPKSKHWYATYKKEYYKYRKWFQSDNTSLIVCDSVFVGVATRNCFKCKKETTVISLLTNSYVDVSDDWSFLEWGEMHFVQDVTELPDNLAQYLDEKYCYRKGFSQTTSSYYYGNHCNHCGVLQGNHFIYEVGSSFFIYDEASAKALTLYEIPVINDLEMEATVSLGSTDWMIGQYANIIDSGLTYRRNGNLHFTNQ